MRRIRLDLAYDGSGFAGWQIQSGGRTVQGEIERALARLAGGESPRLYAAGRTDAGVHALGQVAHFETKGRIPLDGWRRGLNSALPDDIAVLRAADAPETFDARRSAVSKRYRYRILSRDPPDPFERAYAWHVRGRLDEGAMRAGSEALRGTHDFSSFRAAGCDAAHAIRTLTELAVGRQGDLVVVEVESRAFLRHMVRNIVGTLVDVGLGRTAPQDVARILERRDRRAAGPTAPARGLWLVRVTYPEALGPAEAARGDLGTPPGPEP